MSSNLNTIKRNTDNENKRKVGNGLEIPGANFGGRVGIQLYRHSPLKTMIKMDLSLSAITMGTMPSLVLQRKWM
jgi:hypothetical protein